MIILRFEAKKIIGAEKSFNVSLFQFLNDQVVQNELFAELKKSRRIQLSLAKDLGVKKQFKIVNFLVFNFYQLNPELTQALESVFFQRGYKNTKIKVESNFFYRVRKFLGNKFLRFSLGLVFFFLFLSTSFFLSTNLDQQNEILLNLKQQIQSSKDNLNKVNQEKIKILKNDQQKIFSFLAIIYRLPACVVEQLEVQPNLLRIVLYQERRELKQVLQKLQELGPNLPKLISYKIDQINPKQVKIEFLFQDEV